MKKGDRREGQRGEKEGREGRRWNKGGRGRVGERETGNESGQKGGVGNE